MTWIQVWVQVRPSLLDQTNKRLDLDRYIFTSLHWTLLHCSSTWLACTCCQSVKYYIMYQCHCSILLEAETTRGLSWTLHGPGCRDSTLVSLHVQFISIYMPFWSWFYLRKINYITCTFTLYVWSYTLSCYISYIQGTTGEHDIPYI